MRIFGILFVILFGIAMTLWVLRTPNMDIAVLEAKYGGPPSQFVTLAVGERVHFRDQGNRHGRVLVLLHGTAASLHTWEPWVALLGDDYRIITLDLPGHGLTGPVPDCTYSVECAVRVVEAVRQHLGLEHFVLGGNSFGGNISWRYGLTYPQYVDGLILSDASGGPDINPAPMTLSFAVAQIPVVNLLLDFITPRALVKSGLEDATRVAGIVTDEKIERYWHLLRRPGNRQAMRKRLTAPNSDAIFRPELAQMHTPTLILWGREDQFVDLADGLWFGKTIPNAQVAVYDGVGHLPMVEVPVLSAIDVREFLQSLPPRVPEPHAN